MHESKKESYCETSDERYRRYKKAYDRLFTYWQSKLEDIYDYCLPGRNTWNTPTEGASKTVDIFDDTAVQGVQNFATNSLTFLMPPFKQFMSLGISTIAKKQKNLSDGLIQQIEESLDDQMATLFEYLNQSGYANAFHEAFQDLAAGTGVIIINEGDDNRPFSFASVPIPEIAFEEGPSGRLENFWRTRKYSTRQIKRLWSMAVLPEELESLYKNRPDEEIEIVEGVIYYPQNDEDSCYFYYVSDVKSKKDLYSDFRSYSPFLGFRYSKLAGEVMGRGPAFFAIDYIRILNLLVEYDLRGAKFDAFPTYLVPSTQIINPNTATFEPGSIIPIDAQFAGEKAPIQPLPGNPNKNDSQLRMEYYQSLIREIFASDPLPSPDEQKNSTATEANIRYKEWIRKNSSSVSRLQDELIMPLFEVLLKILRKKALIKDVQIMNHTFEIKVNGSVVKLVYDSPILDSQKSDELSRLDQYMARATQWFGQYGVLATNYWELPNFSAERLNLSMELIPTPADVKAMLTKIFQQMTQPPPAAQPGQQPGAPQGQNQLQMALQNAGGQ